MRLPAKTVAWLLPFLLTACFHKTNQQQVRLAPPIEDAPPAKPAPPSNLPPPVVTPPAPEKVPTDTATAPAPPKPAPKHRRPPKNTQQIAAAPAPEPAEVSAIGQLSSGDPSDVKRQTADSIAAIERGLNGITRTLNDQEQKTAVQIREFLKQAHEALTSGDVEGARTLSVKAKVLLAELNP